MDIALAALVDRIEETDTKLSLVGIIGVIRVEEMPIIVQREMRLFIRVSFEPSEIGEEHVIEMKCFDPDRCQIMEGRAKFRLREDVMQDINFRIRLLPFRVYGRHKIWILLDGERKHAVEFLVGHLRDRST